MGVKLSKRGSYNFKKDLRKVNKFERRAISYIALTSSEIYGDYAEDVNYRLPKSQSVPKINTNEETKSNENLLNQEYWKEQIKKNAVKKNTENSSVAKRSKREKRISTLSDSKSLEEFLTHLASTDEDSSYEKEDIKRNVSRTVSQNQSEDDQFYDAQEFNDDITDYRQEETITKKTLQTQKAVDLEETDNTQETLPFVSEENNKIDLNESFDKNNTEQSKINESKNFATVTDSNNSNLPTKKVFLETSFDEATFEGKLITRPDILEGIQTTKDFHDSKSLTNEATNNNSDSSPGTSYQDLSTPNNFDQPFGKSLVYDNNTLENVEIHKNPEIKKSNKDTTNKINENSESLSNAVFQEHLRIKNTFDNNSTEELHCDNCPPSLLNTHQELSDNNLKTPQTAESSRLNTHNQKNSINSNEDLRFSENLNFSPTSESSTLDAKESPWLDSFSNTVVQNFEIIQEDNLISELNTHDSKSLTNEANNNNSDSSPGTSYQDLSTSNNFDQPFGKSLVYDNNTLENVEYDKNPEIKKSNKDTINKINENSESFSNAVFQEYLRIKNTFDNNSTEILHCDNFLPSSLNTHQELSDNNSEISQTAESVRLNTYNQKNSINSNEDLNFNENLSFSSKNSTLDAKESLLLDSFSNTVVHNFEILQGDNFISQTHTHVSTLPINTKAELDETKGLSKFELPTLESSNLNSDSMQKKKLISNNNQLNIEPTITQDDNASNNCIIISSPKSSRSDSLDSNTPDNQENLNDSDHELKSLVNEDETTEELKMILLSLTDFKEQIQTESYDVGTYQQLMRIMMEVNNIKNDDFDENIMEMQDNALSEIRSCLAALKLKTK